MQFTGIIPARYASTRFPGKPLALIGDKPMIQRVYEQAHKTLDEVVVATDDIRIYNCVRDFGGKAVMTGTHHRCGTERCLEAWNITNNTSKTNVNNDNVIINIQGDEPFIQPEQIEALCSCFDEKDTQIATLVKTFTEEDGLQALENPNSPKVAVAWNRNKNNKIGYALLFSRSVIPFLRGVDRNEWLQKGNFYKHIGMYAYRADVLKEITILPPTPLEQAESLEQLRWIENGYKITVARCNVSSIGIDTPEDLILANNLFQSDK